MIRGGRAWLILLFVAWPLSMSRGDGPPADLAPRAVATAPEDLRAAVSRTLDLAGPNAAELAGAILDAPEGEQRGAVAFLVAHLPPVDRPTTTKASLLANVACAFRAREATPWARLVPMELFRNDVLPTTSLNERRDDWRRDFADRFLPIVRECPSATAAADKLNVAVFDAFHVRYHASKRPKPDQSPYESAQAGFASCTGLSILLVDACRSVGIPARLVGTPKWTKQPGNHTWVEIWDKEWKFIGACEAGRFNDGWFVEQAAAADETRPENRIYATSFAEAATRFPMVWRPGDRDYPAEDVTRRYTKRRRVTFRLADEALPGVATVRQGGRVVAEDRLAPATTFELPGDTDYEVEFRPDGQSPTTRAVRVTDQAEQVIPLAPR